jgi:hypothetical protein
MTELDRVDFASALAHLRAICAELPEVNDRLSHGSPTFFVRDKKTICNLHDIGHHHEAVSMWANAPEGVQQQLVETEPDRFFVPPYVGHRGWIGVRLDVDVDWDEIAAIVTDAYRMVAPRSLVAELESRS